MYPNHTLVLFSKINEPFFVDYNKIAKDVFLATDATRLMREVGMQPPSSLDKKFSVMGKPFDPKKPEEYLNSFAISRTKG